MDGKAHGAFALEGSHSHWILQGFIKGLDRLKQQVKS